MASACFSDVTRYSSTLDERNSAHNADARCAALAQLARLDDMGPRAISHAIQRLRREVFEDGVMSRDEADAMFALERSDYASNPEWRDFFIPAIVDYILWQSRPSGVINEAKAEWLLSQADRARTPSSFAILVVIAQEAHRLTAWFPAALRGRAAKGWPGIAQKESKPL